MTELEKRIKENLKTKNPILDLSGLDLTGKEPEFNILNQANHLQELYLRANNIQDLSPLKDLKQLQELDLSSNWIKSLSPLKDLEQLQELNLSFNKIQDLSPLKDLKQLQELNLFKNQIQDLLPLKDLKQLQKLDLRLNKIQDLLPLKDLKQVQRLGLSFNDIQNLSPLKDLKQVQYLILHNNHIQDLSPLKNLKQVQELDLSSNKIQDLSPLKDLKQLQELYLFNNQIQNISLEFVYNFSKLEYLSLHANPIQNIPQEIFNQDGNVLSDVHNYLKDKVKGSQKNKTLKALLIGNGSVGKTQIAQRLAKGKDFIFDTVHHSTQSIVCLDKDVEDVTLQLWDFAGQDLYHATHRVFMQSRALFFLVWDFENEQRGFHEWQGKQYDNEALEYWLEYAQHFGQGSPIIILQNKIDDIDPSKHKLPESSQIKYKKNYAIINFLQVSAKNGKGFKVLENILQDAFQTNKTLKEYFEQDIPTSWLKVQAHLKDLQTKGIKQLSIEDFKSYCEKEQVLKSTFTLLDYLHNTGFLYYRKAYFNNQIIIDPAWAIEAIYKVLNRESDYFEVLEYQKGKLSYQDITKVWTKNTDEERALFIGFMLSAELIFETTQNKEWDTPLTKRSFIITQFLAKEKSEEVNFELSQYLDKKITKVLKYAFLPKIIIQRFIVRANRFSQPKFMWQKGIFLKAKEGIALVEVNYQTKTITISANNNYIIQKIKEELAYISEEGKINAYLAQEKSENSLISEAIIVKEKYWDYIQKQKGLKALHSKNNNMSNYIKEALLALENAELATFFDKIDYINLPDALKINYAKFKKEFMHGNTSYEFVDRLKVFANALSKEAGSSETEGKIPQTANLDKVYNFLENGDLEEAITAFSDLVDRKHKLYSNIINIKTRWKDYKDKDLKGFDTRGEQEKIISDFTQILQKYEEN